MNTLEGTFNYLHASVQEELNKDIKEDTLLDILSSDIMIEFISKQISGKKKTETKKPRKISGYIKFGKHIRPQIKSENLTVTSSQEITKLIAKKWNELSNEDKQLWNDTNEIKK